MWLTAVSGLNLQHAPSAHAADTHTVCEAFVLLAAKSFGEYICDLFICWSVLKLDLL